MTACPKVVAWEMTRRCNLVCRHCRAAAGSSVLEGELTRGEGLRLVRALAALPVRLLILTGGEPMMRDDLYDLARAAAAGGVRVVAAPCGPLLDAESAVRLKAAGISAVSLSLDAPTAAEHDAFRGVEGAFEAALRGLRHARAAGLSVQINTTVSRLNVHQLPALLELAEQEGAATLDCFFLVPTGRGRAMKELQLDAEQAEQALQWIADVDGTRSSVRVKTTCAPQMARVLAQRGLKRQHGGPTGGCMAGRGFLFISHTGTVQPCGFLDLPCGSVRDFDFDLRALLDASADLRRLGALAGVKGRCGNCAFLRVCGGCRARAHEMLGDAMGEEPFCIGDGRVAHRDRVPERDGPSPVNTADAAHEGRRPVAPGAPATRRIAVALQRGVPLESRPFAALAATLGVTEEDVLDVARRMLADGSARRFGAVFDARRLGYRSELCALAVPDDTDALDRLGAVVAAQPGVTHGYLRGHPPGLPPFESPPGLGTVPNLWFTLSVPRDRFDREMARMQRETEPFDVLRFPALRRFKIDVIFDEDQRHAGEQMPGSTAAAELPFASGYEALTESDRALVRALDGNVPLAPDFFAGPSAALGLSVDTVMGRLRAWRSSGTLRRLALIVRHQRMGFVANAMCLWPVGEDAVLDAGRRLAAWASVTHCYQRAPRAGWPYTLYAMIHAGDWISARGLFERIGADAGLGQGRMLGSLREYKKTSMQYFTEEE